MIPAFAMTFTRPMAYNTIGDDFGEQKSVGII